MATLLTLELTPPAAESCVSSAALGVPELPAFEGRTGTRSGLDLIDIQGELPEGGKA
jgi:hypothetical protein